MTLPSAGHDDPAAAAPIGRQRLVEAAMACVAEYGYQGATVRRIAERAGVTQGLIRHHFVGKDALLVEAYQHINKITLEAMSAAVEARHDDPAGALSTVIAAFFPPSVCADDAGEARRMRMMVAFWGLAVTNPQFRAVQLETNRAFQEFFIVLIGRYFGARDDAAEIANGVIALADGLWLACCLNPQEITPGDAVKTTTAFCLARLKVDDSQKS